MEAPKAYAITNDVWMVPCLLVKAKKHYQPLLRPYKTLIPAPQKKLRKYWTTEEDQTLSEIVNSTGPHNWSSIAKLLNIKLHNSFQTRKGKQCRERWLIHLDPTLIKSKWSEDEDRLLMQKHEELGNKWTQIARFFLGRNENQVKNRWKVLKRVKIDDSSNNSETHLLEKTGFGSFDKEQVNDEYSLDNIEPGESLKNCRDEFINIEKLENGLEDLWFLDHLLQGETIEDFKQDALAVEDELEVDWS